MKYILVVFIFSLFIGCSSQQNTTAGNYTYKTECLGLELDGSQTLKAWGNGRNRSDAVEQAKKNAVNDVLFNGIYEGKSVCEKRPIVSEVNARQKYEDYFNEFFTDGGDYKKYISLKDERILQKLNRNRKGGRESITQGLIVRVLRSDLKKEMIKNGIIK